MDAIEIGKRIKQRREELHLTQEDLGIPLGFNKSTIQRYEAGKIRKIKLPVLESMAKVLRVEPNWLALKTDKSTLTFSEKISKRRKELGLTMLEVAQKVGVSEGTVSRWESGDIANMRRDKIVLLAKALQLSPAFIMGWDDEDNIESTTTLPRQTGEHLFLSPTQEKILSNCKQLNETGQKKVLDFSDDLISSNNYNAIGRYGIAAHGAGETEENVQLPDEEIFT